LYGYAELNLDDLTMPVPRNVLTFIFQFIKNYKFYTLTFAFIAMITGLWGPFNNIFIKLIIDGLTASNATQLTSAILWPSILLVVNYEIHNMCWRGMNYLKYKYAPVIKNEIIRSTFGYVHEQSHQYFQDNLAGRLASQINTLADNIERIVTDISRHLIRCLVLVIVSMISMYIIHPDFFYALTIWLIFFVSYSLYKSKKLIHLSEVHADAESNVTGQLVDSITNSSNVRIFARRMFELSHLDTTLNQTKKAYRAKEMYALLLHYFQGTSLSIMLSVMMYFLIQLRLAQKVTIGDFALILGLSIELGFMVWWSLEQVDELNKAMGKCKQALATLFVEHGIQDKKDAMNLLVTNGQITFQDVKFHYKGAEPLFQNKSVTIPAGQKVGLVGYSGGGNNLILRLYDVTDGKIMIDGQDIREVTQESLRHAIAMIPQDPSLFHRTLMENIRYGRVSASNAEVYDAARRAHADEFIEKLSQGYESLVGERGVKLSGGQRQRIAIARAILKNAPILILDEATSQLDSLTESHIQESLWELMQDKTTIVVAHRLSTLLHMDRILVFDQGKIVEDGTHSELLEIAGVYKTLWDAQVGGFLPDNIQEEA
jgi:ATP-binding cassette subfamily B protein